MLAISFFSIVNMMGAKDAQVVQSELGGDPATVTTTEQKNDNEFRTYGRDELLAFEKNAFRVKKIIFRRILN